VSFWQARDNRLSVYAVLAFAVLVVAVLVIRNILVPDPLSKLRKVEESETVTVYEGSWKLPRGGPFIFGFDSPNGKSRILIDGELVCEPGRRKCADATGSHFVRRVYPAGVVAIRFEAARDTRLLWHPPGRRGPPEYVPPSSLSSDGPDVATFGAWSGAAPVDGICALILLLALLGLVAFLARSSLSKVPKETWYAFFGVLLLGLIVRLIGLGDAGQTWDEDVNWSAGKNYVTNILALDFDDRSWVWNMQHPPIMKYLVGIGAQFADGYNPARAVSAVIMATAGAICVLIGQRLFSLRVGILAGIFAVLSPHLIAHGKIVGHEATTALWWALGFHLTLVAHGDDLDDDRWQRRFICSCIALGIVLGLALMSRFVNALLAPLIGLSLVVGAPAGRRIRTAALGGVIIAVVCVIAAVVVWPRLWSEPVAHLQEAWAILKKPHAAEPFLGSITNNPPRYYFVVYLLSTAPVLLLIAFFGGAVRLATQRLRGSLQLGLWLLVPLLVALSPVRQDGVRYIIPSLLALSTIAAVGVHWCCSRYVRAELPLVALMIIYLAVTNYRIHPYYLDYYGEQVGGPSSVVEAKRFEVAWWGEGVEDVIAYVNKHAARGDRVYKRCVEPSHLAWLRDDLWPEARHPKAAQWVIVYQAGWRKCPVPDDFKKVHEVRAQGAPLAAVYRRE
jgi:4-amino-4-deoxy-L-arabinose transferase-like glycosyltransferase